MGGLLILAETEKEFITVSIGSIAISVNTVLQSEEKEKRAQELVIANSRLKLRKKKKPELHTAKNYQSSGRTSDSTGGT
jgi:hypothetical protein